MLMNSLWECQFEGKLKSNRRWENRKRLLTYRESTRDLGGIAWGSEIGCIDGHSSSSLAITVVIFITWAAEGVWLWQILQRRENFAHGGMVEDAETWGLQFVKLPMLEGRNLEKCRGCWGCEGCDGSGEAESQGFLFVFIFFFFWQWSKRGNRKLKREVFCLSRNFFSRSWTWGCCQSGCGDWCCGDEGWASRCAGSWLRPHRFVEKICWPAIEGMQIVEFPYVSSICKDSVVFSSSRYRDNKFVVVTLNFYGCCPS